MIGKSSRHGCSMRVQLEVSRSNWKPQNNQGTIPTLWSLAFRLETVETAMTSEATGKPQKQSKDRPELLKSFWKLKIKGHPEVSRSLETSEILKGLIAWSLVFQLETSGTDILKSRNTIPTRNFRNNQGTDILKSRISTRNFRNNQETDILKSRIPTKNLK